MANLDKRTVKIFVEALDNNSIVEVKKRIDALNASQQNLVATNKTSTAEYKKNETELVKLNNRLENYKKQINEAKAVMDDLSGVSYNRLVKTRNAYLKQLKNLERGTDEYNKTLKAYKALSAEVNRRTEEMGKKQAGLAGALNSTKMAFIGLTTAIATGFIAAMRNGIKTIIDFDKESATLASVLGTTQDQIGDLTKMAKELGSTTEYTAAQIVQLETEYAKLGFNNQEIKDVTASTLAFATAVGTDLANAAKLAGATLRGFNLSTRETERVVSAMAVATTKSALDFEYLNSAMSSIAPVAKTFGFSIEETTALLGTLANAGFDASSAATATRNILLNLANASGKLAKALGEPIKSFDELIPALVKLREKGVDLNATLELTDKRSVAAFNTFLTGAENATILRDSITGVNNELYDMAETRLDTVAGQITLLKSAWDGLILSFSESKGVMKTTISWLTEIINGYTWLLNGGSKQEQHDYLVNLSYKDQFDIIEAINKDNSFSKEDAKKYWEDTYDKLDKAAEEVRSKRDAAKSTIDKSFWGMGTKFKEAQKDFETYSQKATDLEGRVKAIKEYLDELNAAVPPPEPLKKEIKLGKTIELTEKETKVIEQYVNSYTILINREKEINEERLKYEGLYNVSREELTKEQFERLETIEKEYYTNVRKIEVDAENRRYENVLKSAGLFNADVSKLEGDRLKAYQNMVAEHNTNLLKIDEDYNKKLFKQMKQANDGLIAAKDNYYSNEQSKLADQLSQNLITQEEYDYQSKVLEEQHTADIYALYLDFYDVMQDYQAEYGELSLEEQQAINKKIEEAQKKHLQAMRNLNKTATPTESFISKIYKEYGISTKAETSTKTYNEKVSEVTSLFNEKITKATGDDKIALEKARYQVLAALAKEHEEEVLEIRKKYSLLTRREIFDKEVAAVNEMVAKGVLTEKEGQEAILELKLKNISDYLSQAAAALEYLSNLNQAYYDYKFNQLNAEKQKELTLAANNEEKRAAIEEDYAQKELDLKKQQANADAAISIAEIGLKTAVAIMNVWATAKSKAMAIALTAIVSAIGVAQTAAAIAERNAIMNTTLSGSSISTSGSRTSYVPSDTLGGYSEGGYTGKGGRYDVAGVVHKGEYVVAQPEMQNPIVMRSVEKIEELRIARLNHTSKQFADGGYTSPDNSIVKASDNAAAVDTQLLKDIRSLLQYLKANKIEATVSYTDFEKKRVRYDRSVERGSR